MPRSASGARRAQSTGLAGDLEQLSALNRAPLSPQQHAIHMQETEADQGIPYGESAENTDDESGAAGAGVDERQVTFAEEEGEEQGEAPSAAVRATDPARSGQFDGERVGCFLSVWRAILRFGALSAIFPLTLFVCLFSTFLNVLVAPQAFQGWADPTQASFLPSTGGFVICLLSTVLLVCVALLATRQLAYQLVQGEIKPMQIIGMYLSTILLYGQLYMTCAFLDPSSFVFEQGVGDAATTNVVSVWVGFQYFSVTTITCTGLGDIYPRYWFPKLIACTELLMSIFYHIGIFSIGLEHFQSVAERVGEGDAAAAEHAGVVAAARARMKNFREKHPRLDAIRKVFIRFVFAFSLLTQLVILLVLHIFDPNMFNVDRSADAGLIFIFFLAQLFQLLLIILMTLALVRAVNKSQVSPLFLLQSWLATVSLFCGLYCLIYLLVPGFQSFHIWNGAQIGAVHAVPDVVGQFFWLSLTTMTTTGYGDVYPVHLAARLCSSLQMIIGVLYTVVILGQALASTVAYINHLRVERGAEAIRGGRTRSAMRSVPQRLDEEEEEEAEVMSLEKFEGALPPGGEVYDSYTASEAEEEEAGAAAAMPPSRAAPVRRALPPAVRSNPPPAAAAPAPSQAAPARARVAPTAAAVPAPQRAARPAAAVGAAAAPVFAPGVLEEARDAISESGRELAQATAQAAHRGAAEVRRAAPGAMAAGARVAAAGQRAATATAQRASQALESAAPGLQAEVRQEARAAAGHVATAARVGGAAVGAAASEAKAKAMAVPEVQAAVRATQPRVESARQALAQAGAKAKAAAQQAAVHARQQSRGMFDRTEEEEQEDVFQVDP